MLRALLLKNQFLVYQLLLSTVYLLSGILIEIWARLGRGHRQFVASAVKIRGDVLAACPAVQNCRRPRVQSSAFMAPLLHFRSNLPKSSASSYQSGAHGASFTFIAVTLPLP